MLTFVVPQESQAFVFDVPASLARSGFYADDTETLDPLGRLLIDSLQSQALLPAHQQFTATLQPRHDVCTDMDVEKFVRTGGHYGFVIKDAAGKDVPVTNVEIDLNECRVRIANLEQRLAATILNDQATTSSQPNEGSSENSAAMQNSINELQSEVEKLKSQHAAVLKDLEDLKKQISKNR